MLVGMMGAGKSTVGRLLAEELGVGFKDTDSLIESRLGRPTSQVFKLFGEDTFRQHETAILRSLPPDDDVLATGGGIVLRDENWVEMRRLGPVVFLDVEAERLRERLRKSKRKRPLLERDDWEKVFDDLLESRRPLYMQADIVVDVNTEDFSETIAKILSKIEELGSE